MENRIKEQQLGLFADRTSSATFRSHQQCHLTGEPAAAVLLFLCLCPAAWPAPAGPDRYGICQSPEHDDPPEAPQNRRPLAPDGA
ncbi:hypothetical protein [Thiolapillus sp.]|uniref:hypothetical protein n=1 Tax=Thiolapillus sp. TaxID=2017437 RepID=UPI003AF9C701